MHRFAMLEQDLVCRPVGDIIDPASSRIQKKNRDPEDEQQDSFGNFEKGDQLEIANAVLRPKDFEISGPMRHS